jgi:heat shock protein HslJ
MTGALTSLLLAGCGVSNTGDTGVLNGQWEIEQVADDNGTLSPPVDDDTALLSASGATALTLRRTGSSLESSLWLVTGINNQTGGVQTVLADTKPTLWFRADGQLDAAAGCNDLTSFYTFDNASIEVGPVRATIMMCRVPDGLMEQERNMAVALEKASTHVIGGISLNLRNADGHTMPDARRLLDSRP